MADDSKDDEATIKVASKKSSSGAKPKTTAVFKLKEKFPKVKEPGDYERGHVVEGALRRPSHSHQKDRCKADVSSRESCATDPKKAKANAAATRDRASSPGDAVNKLDDLPLETFEKGIPLVDIPALFSCKWCKKSSLMTTAVEHINACLKVKKEKANRKKAAREARERAKEQALREERERRAEEEGVVLGADGDSPDEDEDEKVPGGKTTKKAAGKKAGGDGDAKGKKRKADGEPAEKAPSKKKKKEEQKPKAKPKGESARLHCVSIARDLLADAPLLFLGPVDVERQCGVLLPNGQPCARSLTCKSHSMGAKRAVAGRSLPYDMLLAAYQKKNQARQQSKCPNLLCNHVVCPQVTKQESVLQRLHWMPMRQSKRTKTLMPVPSTRTKSTTRS